LKLNRIFIALNWRSAAKFCESLVFVVGPDTFNFLLRFCLFDDYAFRHQQVMDGRLTEEKGSANAAQSGSHPVYNEELRQSVAKTSQFEAGCEQGVVIATRVVKAHHHEGGADEGVECGSVFGAQLAYCARRNPTNEGGH